MLKSLGKGETLISCDVIFQFSCYSVFYSSENYQELNMAKSKILVFKTEANWGSFPLQTRYLVKKTYFCMFSSSYTCCTFHIGSGVAAWSVILTEMPQNLFLGSRPLGI